MLVDLDRINCVVCFQRKREAGSSSEEEPVAVSSVKEESGDEQKKKKKKKKKKAALEEEKKASPEEETATESTEVRLSFVLYLCRECVIMTGEVSCFNSFFTDTC